MLILGIVSLQLIIWREQISHIKKERRILISK